MQKVDALLPSIIELDSFADCGDEKAYDAKIQEIATKIGEAHADAKAEIDKIYSSRKFNSVTNKWGRDELDELSKAQFKEIQEKILNVLDKAMPDLQIQPRIQKQHALRQALYAAIHDGDMIQLERLFKEEKELDLSTPVEMPKCEKIGSYLSYIVKNYFMNWEVLFAGKEDRERYHNNAMQVFKFFLKHGAKITDAKLDDIWWFLNGNQSNKYFDAELIKLLHAQDCLKYMGLTKYMPPDAIHTAILYGSYLTNYIVDAKETKHFDELFVLRNELMNKNFPDRTYRSLNMSEKEFIFKRGEEIYQCRNQWRNEVVTIENREYCTNHVKFIRALLERQFAAAEDLLKNIDINASLVLFPPYGHVPLLVFAVINGDIETINFLLKAGANVNIFYHIKDVEEVWQPPLMMAFMHEVPNQEQVVELLKKAGADINLRDAGGTSIINHSDSLNVSDQVKTLESYIKCGLNIYEIDLISQAKGLKEEDELRRAMIFYGGGRIDSIFKPELAKIRDETLAEMNREILRHQVVEEMLKIEALKGFSKDVIGEIAGYHNVALSNLTPEQRLELHRRCQRKYLESQPAG
jgi:hypothetical protein